MSNKSILRPDPSPLLLEIPVRIDVVLGVVDDVAVAVKVLRIEDRLDEGIGGDKPPGLGVVIPAAVMSKARSRTPTLPGLSMSPARG